MLFCLLPNTGAKRVNHSQILDIAVASKVILSPVYSLSLNHWDSLMVILKIQSLNIILL